ncbi:nucleotide cyclase, HAMP and GGDEF-related domain-containing [Geobacter metallireducens GS-15]|uniref:diguanylate cyclase n=2 Tax=Geobacter metallireducens TaxID=28232 RepID=Q39U56_GEOMG|nr:diguanylate cyclase [Geobacter metallireducens]ABB32218.1 nucleotide cyclase, HAMP and GGDEF-related domain-containing [Geobacter metallireducens GS-15]
MSDSTKPLQTRTRFTLIQKLIVSYVAMLFLTTTALAFSVMGLYSLNRTAKEIAKTDLFIIDSANRLRESMLAQERIAGKYAILKSDEFKLLYSQRQSEFLAILGEIGQRDNNGLFRSLVARYDAYRKEIERAFAASTTEPLPAKKEADAVVSLIEDLSSSRQKLLGKKLAEADRREADTVKLTLFLAFSGFILAVTVAALNVHSISTSIRKLKKGMHRIAEGDFDYDPQIPIGDEIGALAEDFSRMGKKLKELEQISLDASPLTRLPGNIAIERVLNKLLQSGEPFAVCYADLDNFKAYNDRYGYIKASEVIKLTAELIHDTVRELAGGNAFVGHVGGDDFVMVVAAERGGSLCEAVIKRFDDFIRNHYSAEDLARGAIEGVDRYGVSRTFPIMSISVAVVISQQGEFTSAVQIAKAAADIKDLLKKSPGSNYLINRRRNPR